MIRDLGQQGSLTMSFTGSLSPSVMYSGLGARLTEMFTFRVKKNPTTICPACKKLRGAVRNQSRRGPRTLSSQPVLGSNNSGKRQVCYWRHVYRRNIEGFWTAFPKPFQDLKIAEDLQIIDS